MAWSPIKPVRPGESVTAGVVSRPDNQLAARTESLKRRLDAAEQGKSLVDFDAPMDSQVLAGQPVYWNTTTTRYEQALAGVETDAESGSLVQTDASEVVGICLRKQSSLVGDVVLFGLVEFSSIADAIEDDSPAGRYYLSATAAGKLTSQKPAVSVPVCYIFGPPNPCDPLVRVLVAPQTHDFLENHIHHRFSLTCRPAGDTAPPGEGERHVISNADVTLEGWLPAGHASFNGLAPTGAAFGYNLAAHTALQRIWPPIPIQAVAVLWDKGEGLLGATEVPQGYTGLVICDLNGIWWMSDCVGDVPWPETLDTAISDSLSLSISETPECGRSETMRLDIVFSRQVFGTDHSVVTSLVAAEGSPITITNCDGITAGTGDLEIAIDPDLVLTDDADAGSLAVKQVGTTGFNLKRGRVTEGLISGSEAVVLTSTHSRLLDPDDDNSGTVHQGIVTVDVVTEPAERELAAELVRLDDAKQTLIRNIPCIELPAGKTTSLRVKFQIPPAGLPTSPTIQIRVALFGPSTGTMAALDMSYRRIARPAPTTALAAEDDVEATFDSATEVSAYTLIEVSSDAIEVAAGDTVLVTISRTGNAGYAGAAEILRIGAVISGS